MNYNTFKIAVSKIRANQANYQKVVICDILNTKDQTKTKDDISLELLAQNSGKTLQFFTGASCPVWGVLGDKGLIIIKNGLVKLPVKLDKKQVNELRVIVDCL